jgi:ADP-ribose pyrophosphatase
MLEKTVKSEIAYKGLIFDVERIDIELDDGTASKRDVIRHNGAVGVVARKPDGNFVFVKQYRKAIEQITLECVAGTLEKGEDPVVCAERELAEETGYQAGELIHLGRVCPSPGYLDEKIEIFYTEITGTVQAEQDEDEHCEPIELSWQEIESAIDSGEIIDSKTLAAWLMFLRKIDV